MSFFVINHAKIVIIFTGMGHVLLDVGDSLYLQLQMELICVVNHAKQENPSIGTALVLLDVVHPLYHRPMTAF